MINKKEKGFTMVEILAVLFIFAILLSIVFLNYKQNQKKMILDSAAYKLAADIRKQQSSVGLNDAHCSSVSGYRYGYGLYFNIADRNSYTLFSDCDGNNIWADSSDYKVKSIDFPSDVELDSIGPGGSLLNISFYPPGLSVMINGDQSLNSATIKIRLKSDNLVTKTINVNKFGMTDIDN